MSPLQVKGFRVYIANSSGQLSRQGSCVDPQLNVDRFNDCDLLQGFSSLCKIRQKCQPAALMLETDVWLVPGWLL